MIRRVTPTVPLPASLRLEPLAWARLGTAVGLVCLASAGLAQTAPAADAAPAEAADEIVVTGFRASLAEALDIKRDSVSVVDAIVAEDIAKFPDQNLAESLQRIPGVSIQRDGGEGRAVSVRGLGPQFTRVRLNGLETIATSTDGASANRDRAFDFNVFASELFSQLVVRKTAEASLDEGSLGAVIDLSTGRPLDGKDGLTLLASGQISYNSLSEDVGPRLAGLVSWKSPDGTFGVLVSAAYSQNNTFTMGNNTVRWAQARFDSVNGTACWTRPNSGGSYVPSPGCDAVALAFHPRIPRYGEIAQDRERLGLTGSVQWEPTDRTRLSVDGLFSRFSETRTEKWGEVLFRSLERPIDVVNYQIDADNNLISGTFNDVPVRMENYRRESQTKFWQVSALLEQELSDTFKVSVKGGLSQSDATISKETTIVFDDRDAQGYRYDYTNMERPLLAFGTDVTNPANFQLSEIRDRPSSVLNKFKTLAADADWDVNDQLKLQAGGVWRKFDFSSEAFTRDTVVCPTRTTAAPDVVLGTITCTPSSVFGPSAVYGFPVTAALSENFLLSNAGAPRGTTNFWLIPNLDSSAEYTKLYSRTPAVDAGNTRSVTEETGGGYLQATWDGDVGDMRLILDGGIRYVKTWQTSSGLNSGTFVTVKRTYDDWLPAFNVALFPTEKLILRGAYAKTMTRPTLGNLTPGGSVDGFNYRVSYGNPFLDPFRADSYDLSLEWYFADQSLFSVALFKKDVSSFPVSQSRQDTFASTGLPLSVIPPSSPAASNPEGQLWTINSIGNGKGATFKGVELSLQAPFKFLPGFWSNFGGLVNATFVDSSADYNVSGPAVVPGGPLIAQVVNTTFFGLSKQAWNATLYYEDDKFSARASATYRSDFLDGTSATGNVLEGYNASFNLDASIRYRLTEQLEVSLEGINLTDDWRSRFTDQAANRNYEYNHFGRTILFGVRYKM